MALRVSSATPLLGSALGALGIGAASTAAGQVLPRNTGGWRCICAPAHRRQCWHRQTPARALAMCLSPAVATDAGGIEPDDTMTARRNGLIAWFQAFRHVRAEFQQEQRPGHAGRRSQPQPLWAGVRRQDLLIDALGGVLLWRVSLCTDGIS